jgi:hypothetical protein
LAAKYSFDLSFNFFGLCSNVAPDWHHGIIAENCMTQDALRQVNPISCGDGEAKLDIRFIILPLFVADTSIKI